MIAELVTFWSRGWTGGVIVADSAIPISTTIPVPASASPIYIAKYIESTTASTTCAIKWDIVGNDKIKFYRSGSSANFTLSMSGTVAQYMGFSASTTFSGSGANNYTGTILPRGLWRPHTSDEALNFGEVLGGGHGLPGAVYGGAAVSMSGSSVASQSGVLSAQIFREDAAAFYTASKVSIGVLDVKTPTTTSAVLFSHGSGTQAFTWYHGTPSVSEQSSFSGFMEIAFPIIRAPKGGA
jgi:hypothetical protein